MKCTQPCSGFELGSPCLFPTTLEITPPKPPKAIDKGDTPIPRLHHFTLDTVTAKL